MESVDLTISKITNGKLLKRTSAFDLFSFILQETQKNHAYIEIYIQNIKQYLSPLTYGVDFIVHDSKTIEILENTLHFLIKYIEPKQETTLSITNKTPFKDSQTKDLFEFIVKYWDNKNTNKWGYIWEYLFTKDNGKLTNKTDYETYLRKHYDFTTGKPNYESCNSEKRYLELDNLKTQFIENLDLN